MKVKIRIKSSISLIKPDAEFESAIPDDEHFELDEEFEDEYTADYMDVGDFVELSYLESSNEGVARVLIYDKSERLLLIRRVVGDQSVDIKVGEGVLHKNLYIIDGIGEIPMETYGKTIKWNGDIFFEYFTYLGEAWSKIVMHIDFLSAEEAKCS